MGICNFQPLLQTKRMPVNKYNGSPGTPRTRLERLLRERELRKNRSAQLNDVEPALSGSELCFSDGENWSVLDEEEFIAAARALSDSAERQEGRSKQRLLVVANRLPVSAIRKGDNSWQLEMSVGGLVSALLGKQ